MKNERFEEWLFWLQMQENQYKAIIEIEILDEEWKREIVDFSTSNSQSNRRWQ